MLVFFYIGGLPTDMPWWELNISCSVCLLTHPGNHLDFVHEMQIDTCKHPKGPLCLTQT